MNEPLHVGAMIEIAHPFVRDKFTDYESDGEGYSCPVERPTWRPGIRMELIPPDDSESVADGIGTQIVTIISLHKPGRFPERVFYTRLWCDPDGREFGKGKLYIKTTQAFRRLIAGYRHEFHLLPTPSKLESAA